MLKNRIIWLAIISTFVPLHSSLAQSGPASGLYQIISGTYIECCGIGGDFRSSLPNESQGFVRLTVDPQSDLATMTFLGEDSQTIFSVVPRATIEGDAETRRRTLGPLYVAGGDRRHRLCPGLEAKHSHGYQ